MVSPAELAQLAESAARAAGEELVRRGGDVGRIDTKTSATDPVSEADRATERLLTRMLREARPDDGLLGEEGADQQGTSGLRWVLDPLDGTVNYLYGLPEWCVSVACEDADGAVAAAVRNPLADESFTAARGLGAFRNGEPIRVNDPVELDRALVATGFAYASERRRSQAAVVARLLPRVRDIRRAGSCALDLCRVAAGQVDAFYERHVHHWDWAAGALIAAEAGAVVTADADGNGGYSLVAGGPALHAALIDIVG
ncbi:MAG TPA: inositol monophosphatase family protein [Egibacteraceae bacterium]|nr:inositol monophosphatase family protein [Egibacteraceae bacterium]